MRITGNIAFYIPQLNVGGAEKVVIELLNNFSHPDVILITDIVNSSWIHKISNDVKVIHLDSSLLYPVKIFHLRKLILKYQIESICSHLTHANIQVILATNNLNVKVYLVEHNITSTYIAQFPKITLLIRIAINYLFPKSSGIICVSEASRKDLITNFNIPSELCSVIYNPIDFNLIDDYSKVALSSDIDQFLKGRKYYVTVGRLEDQKNHLELILWLSNYLINNNLVLVIVGGGSLQTKIEETIKALGLEDFVFITGYSENPYNYISNSIGMIHNAKFEGFGLVLIEGLYLSNQIYCFDFSVSREIFNDENLGSIYSSKDELLALLAKNNFNNNDSFTKKNLVKKYKVENAIHSYKKLFAH